MNFTTTLYPYQQEAVEKLKRLKVSALYMEMGTGKTRTMLELINRRYEKGKIDAVIWMCPTSVIQNLKEEIKYQVGEIPPWIIVAGIQSIQGSDRIYAKLLQLVMTRKVYLVVDESNLVKNFFSKRAQRITELSRHCQYKSILNGTPVSRNESDMFAQWYILDPRILGYQSFYSFAANHLVFREVKDAWGNWRKTNQVVRVLNINYLTEKIAPYSYQITKQEADIKLPPKSYHTWYYRMTGHQSSEYESTKWTYLSEVDEFRVDTIFKLFTALQHVISGREVLTGPNVRMETVDMFDNIYQNPRIDTLADLLDNVGDQQAVIFAKYKSEIDEISQLLTDRGQTFREFTGRINKRQREENRLAFKDGQAQFLLSNKMCGAYGLNLQFCHVVIFYSNDFDYATRAQAEDRVYRLGQKETVYIYDIVCEDTIDELIQGNLDGKTNMVDSFKAWIKRQIEEEKKRKAETRKKRKEQRDRKKQKEMEKKGA